jgi:hypothetical protein
VVLKWKVEHASRLFLRVDGKMEKPVSGSGVTIESSCGYANFTLIARNAKNEEDTEAVAGAGAALKVCNPQ